jgi:hypothetical protein
MLVLLTLAVAPMVVNAVWTVADFISSRYWEDVALGIIGNVLAVAPAVIMAALVLLVSRIGHGLPVITVGCLVVSLAAFVGYGLAWWSASSTGALVFLTVIPVQWLATVVSGVIVIARRSLAGAIRLSPALASIPLLPWIIERHTAANSRHCFAR